MPENLSLTNDLELADFSDEPESKMNKLLQVVVVGFGVILQIAAAQAEPLSIAWTAESEHALIVNDIVAMAPGAYCLAGADLDTGLAQTHAIIQKLDSSRGQAGLGHTCTAY